MKKKIMCMISKFILFKSFGFKNFRIEINDELYFDGIGGDAYSIYQFLDTLDRIIQSPKSPVLGYSIWTYFGLNHNGKYKWGCRFFTYRDFKVMKKHLEIIRSYYEGLEE